MEEVLKTGCMPVSTLEKITKWTKTVDGDFAELGVYKGGLFKKLVPIANSQGKMVHGFDSFCGMDKPSEFDDAYPMGSLSNGGIKRFITLIGLEKGYKLYEGYVPKCLEKCDEDVRFSFIFIDFDHYLPTIAGYEWGISKLNIGGIIGFDDYFDKNTLASKAIKEFMASDYFDDFETVLEYNNQIFFRRLK